MNVDLTAVLNCRMPPGNDAGAETIRDYLKALLAELWREKERFGGKRPFGNSGWEADVYIALIIGGFVEGSVDEDGYYEDCDEAAADALIASAIQAL